MCEQRLDLENSMTKLRNVISEMITIMKAQFKEKFKLINKNFDEVFKELFGGGKAELILENEDDVLNCGIDIRAVSYTHLYTNVDGIMIGRAAFGNPWIFREIIHYLKTGEKLEKPTLDERYSTMVRHINMEIEERGEEVAIKEMRKQLSWYIKNLKDSSQMRDKINKIIDKEQLLNEIKAYFEYLKNN